MGSLLAVSFVGLTLVVLAVLWRWTPRVSVVLSALVAWTGVVWIPRAVLILGRDHSVAFKTVRVTLAVVSLGLGVAAMAAWLSREGTPATVTQPFRGRARGRILGR